MTTQVEKTWQTSTGLTVTVTGKIITSKIIDADGDKIEVPCCEKYLDVNLEGHGSQGSWIQMLTTPKTANGQLIVASVGRLGLTAERVEIIRSVEAEIETAPEWQTKVARNARNAREHGTERAKMIRNGYCPKCGTYCHGDCESN